MSNATLKPTEPPPHSPWGHPDVVKRLCEGVYHVATPTHGGMWVAPEAQAIIAERVPGYVPFAHRSNPHGTICWYEEDLDWVVPAVVLADRFAAEGSLTHLQAKDKAIALRGRVSLVTKQPIYPDALYDLIDAE